MRFLDGDFMKLHDGRKLRSGYYRSRRIVWQDQQDTQRTGLQNKAKHNDLVSDRGKGKAGA